MYIYLVTAAVPLILLLKFTLSTDPEPIKGVYQQPGKWYHLKYWVFYCLFTLRRYQNKRKTEVSQTDEVGYGRRSRSSVEEMEKLQPLPSAELHPMAVDAVYFNGGNKDGQFVVAATARRQHRLTQTLLFLRLPDVGLLQLPSQPDTALYRSDEMSYSAGGLLIEPVKAMQKWKVSFKGDMTLFEKKDGAEKLVHVEMTLNWEALAKYFDFDTDLNTWTMCDSMAREKWTREFFDSLKRAHQTHYEQFGELSGTAKIAGYPDQQIRVQGVRDHSYGNIRDWAHLHRYCIQYLHLADGSSICLGVISFPLTMSRLPIGYVFHPDGTMDTPDYVDFELHECGDDINPPKEFEMRFAAGGKRYHLKAKVVEAPVFYMGLDWEAKIYEHFCMFNVNGVEGWGIAEWDYRYKGGCPEDVKKRRKPITVSA